MLVAGVESSAFGVKVAEGERKAFVASQLHQSPGADVLRGAGRRREGALWKCLCQRACVSHSSIKTRIVERK